MNVLFISNDPSIFDPNSIARARMRAYADAIGILHILSAAPSSTPPVTREDLPNGRVLVLYAVPSHPFSRFGALTREAKRIIKDEQIQIVSAQDPFEYGRVAYKATRNTDVKLHLQVHTDVFSPWFTKGNITKISKLRMPAINKVRQKIAARILPKADGIRVVSQRIYDSLIARFGDRIPTPTIIPIAVPTELPAAVPLPEHSFTFPMITVGRLEPEKRIEDIILAVARIHVQYPSVGLFVVGDGSERAKLEKLALNLGLNNHVVFLGKRDDAIGLMQSASAYVQTSAYEGYSRTLIEAALARVPIIATDSGIVGEVFRGYEEILAVPPGDPSAIATQIKAMVEDNSARYQFVAKAEARAREHLAQVHTAPTDIAADLARLLQV